MAHPEGSSMHLRQGLAMTRLALGNYLRSRHFGMSLALAILPVLAAAAFAGVLLFRSGGAFTEPLELKGVGGGPAGTQSIAETLEWMRAAFAAGFLHFGLYFAALTFGNSITREESDEQTLHYLFLQPLPRWVMVLAKLAAFVAMAAPMFVFALFLVHLCALAPFGGAGIKELFLGPTMLRFLQMALTAFVALVVFSALFGGLAAVFKKPIFGLILYFWELMTGFAPVPESVKQISLNYYLRELLPASAKQQTGVFATLTEGPSALTTILVLTLVPVIAMSLAIFLTHKRECIYSDS